METEIPTPVGDSRPDVFQIAERVVVMAGTRAGQHATVSSVLIGGRLRLLFLDGDRLNVPISICRRDPDHPIRWRRFLAGVVRAITPSPPARSEDADATAALQKLGGMPVHCGHDPKGPVIRVEFNCSEFTDTSLKSALPHLKVLNSLRALDLGFTEVTDAGLSDVAELPTLEELELTQTAVTDAGLPHLRQLKKLRMLDLDRTEVTEGGIRDLRRTLPRLKVPRRPGLEKF